LGAERFGVLMIALVTPLIAAQLDLGITSAAVRRFATQMSGGTIDAGKTLFTLTVALAAIGLGLGVALWLAAKPLGAVLGFTAALGPDASVELVRACAIWAAITLATLVPGLVARAGQALMLISIVQTVTTVVLWAGAWWMLRQGMSLLNVVGLAVGLTIAAPAATLVAVRQMIEWRGPVRFESGMLLGEARFSAGMFAAQAAGTLVNQGDRLVVAALGSTAMAGLYALCVNIANKSVAAVVAINSFVLPHAAGLQAAGRDDMRPGLVHALERAVAVLLLPVLVPALLLADTFLKLWLGGFATPELTTAFRVLLIAFAVLAFAVPISNVLVGSGESGLGARYSWSTVVIVFGAMLFAVPRFGLVGAASAVLIGQSTSLLFAAKARRMLHIPPDKVRGRLLAGLAVGCIAQTALVILLGPNIAGWVGLLALGGAAWAVFYITRAIVSALTLEERQLLQRISESARSSAKR
jgi:O-antigen/teichoic acid export membrane protein